MDFQQRLEKIEAQGLLRTLKTIEKVQRQYIQIEGERYLNFTSNDYLGIGQSAIDTTNKIHHLASSRLVSGNDQLYDQIEKEMSHFVGFESALIINSGYDANLAVFQIFKGEDVVVLSDEANHASIIDGIKLSGLPKKIYRHLDNLDLEAQLKQIPKHKTIVIVTDTVFSTNGDKVNLKELVQLKRKYANVLLVIDDSHGFGLGYFEDYQGVDMITSSLSKGLGAFGGIIFCSKVMKAMLINTARPLIYSSGLPESNLDQIQQKFRLLKEGDKRRIGLHELSAYFNTCFSQLFPEMKFSDTAIKAIDFKNQAQAASIYQFLLDQQCFVSYFRYPTVKYPTLRFSLTYYQTEEDIYYLYQLVKGATMSCTV